MIGHIRPIRRSMPKEARREFSQTYCGICKSLRKNYGQSAALAVSNEIALMVLALRKFFVPEVQVIPCPLKLYAGRACASRHSVFDVAAKYSLMLVKLKAEDAARDGDSHFRRKLASFAFKVSLWRVKRTLTGSEQEFLSEYSNAVSVHDGSYHHLKNDGEKLISAFVRGLAQETDVNSAQVERLIDSLKNLSGIILLADAFLDLKQDLREGHENFIADAVERESSSAYFDYLKTLRSLQQALIDKVYKLSATGTTPRAFSYAIESAMQRLSVKVQKNHEAALLALSLEMDESFVESLPESSSLIFASNGGDCCDDCCEFYCCCDDCS